MLSSDGSTLYVAGDDGFLRAYAAEGGGLIGEWEVGGDLDAIALSEDGRYLAITDAEPVREFRNGDWPDYRTDVAVHLFDLENETSETFVYIARGSDYVFGDVAFVGDNTLLMSERVLPGWSGWTPLVKLDLDSGLFDASSTRNYAAYDTSASSLTGSMTNDTVLLGQLDVNVSTYYLLDSEGRAFRSNGNPRIYGYADGIEAFVGEGATGRVAIQPNGDLNLYDGDLNYITNLTDQYSNLADTPGLTFSPDGDILFAIDAANDAIVGIRMDNFAIDFVVPVGDQEYQILRWGEELALSPDGRDFYISTTQGIVRVAFVNDVVGSDIGDSIIGSEYVDHIEALGGNDTVEGNGGDDMIDGGEGNDQIFGGDGGDTMSGGVGDDLLVAGNANGIAATYDHGSVRDMVSGGGGNDTIFAGHGDEVDGGDGIDRLYLSLAGADAGINFKTESFYDFEEVTIGTAVIRNVEMLDGLVGSEFRDTITHENISHWLNVDGGGGNDVFVAKGNARIFADGGDGNDRFISGGQSDTFDGGEGIDTIDYRNAQGGIDLELGLEHGDEGYENEDGDILYNVERVFGSNYADHISGSNNNDRFKGREGDDTIFGNDGRDRIFGNDGDDSLVGGEGRDILSGQNGDDRIEGGADDDRVSGNDGDDRLYGNDGDDILFGGDGADLLNGGAGDDKLLGDGGNDILRGSAGADRFIFRGDFGIDEIADFASGVDRIGLADLRGVNGGDPLTIYQLLISQQGDDTWIELDLDRDGVADVIDLDGDGLGDAVRIELLDFNATTLSAADFQF